MDTQYKKDVNCDIKNKMGGDKSVELLYANKAKLLSP